MVHTLVGRVCFSCFSAIFIWITGYIFSFSLLVFKISFVKYQLKMFSVFHSVNARASVVSYTRVLFLYNVFIFSQQMFYM